MEHKKGQWVIGDIHGCYKTLLALIRQIEASEYASDSITFMGDLIDRGPQSAEVVQYAIDNHIDCCMGNHELFFQMFLDTEVSREALGGWGSVGGDATLESYHFDLNRMIEHAAYIREHFKLFHYYEIEGHGAACRKPFGYFKCLERSGAVMLRHEG